MDLRQGVKINNNLLSYFLAVNLYVIRGSVFHITENITRQQTTTLYIKEKMADITIRCSFGKVLKIFCKPHTFFKDGKKKNTG